MAFENVLPGDKALRAELEVQHKIDDSLSRMFTAPAIPVNLLERVRHEASRQKPVPASTEETDLRQTTTQRRRLLFAALAASVAWGFVSWFVFDKKTDTGYQKLALKDIYQQSVESGFQPDWVCEDDRQFAETFQRRQGQALLLKPIPEGNMIGLAYLKGLTHNTTAMLAHVEGESVIVFVDRLPYDTHPEEPSWWSGLHLFRKELVGLVLYEITPLAEPRVLDSFYPTDVPELPDDTLNVL